MAFAAIGTTCVKCGCRIHHKIVSTGRMAGPFSVEISEGRYYQHLNGELCKVCDKIVPLEEKDPVHAKELEDLFARIKPMISKMEGAKKELSK